MSQFISFLAPTPTITNYDRTQHATEQTAANMPQTFKDAMTVRERVFVEEQNIALENEFDADDARSFHWVVYASVGATGTTNCFKPGAPAAAAPNGESTTTTTTTTKTEADAQEERRRSDPSAHRVAVGTVRLVPPPHPPHPAPSDSHALDNSLAAPATFAAAAAAVANGTASASSPNGHNHSHTMTAIAPPYIKLGRLAILQPYRKLGLARLLVRTALDWAAQHPHLLCPPPSPEAVELAKVEGREGALDGWDGRALVHAQVHLEKFYGSFGFVRDENMGIWDEEGIDHVVLDRALREAASRTGARIAGIRIRWGLYIRTTYSDPNREYASRNNPASYTIVRPSQRARRELFDDHVFGEMQIMGVSRGQQILSTFYSPTHLAQVHRGYRIFYSIDYTDEDGNIITFQNP
ncbi:uncharacterized protein IWZ02DRAFT_497875 [Phyllosticta citriasiana]|uniref:uncharacterized protein n=1 Tax=Phyllosticta citriasiana TaxID=595635 RepID=UPI0030FDCB44